GAFKNYAFVINGEVIDQEALSDYAGATLHTVFSYDTTLQGRKYSGAVLFHTPQRAAPPVSYADDPAYFINGIQVSARNIRWSVPEDYHNVEKSSRDTLIGGVRYHGSIRLNTTEDFFADLLSLPKFLEKYTDTPPIEDVIVHWYRPARLKRGLYGVGSVIQGLFSLYYINPNSIRAIEFSRIRFAEGEKHIVHLIDDGYWSGGDISKWDSQIKAKAIFEDPLSMDTAYPCYVANLDRNGDNVFQLTELKPEPYGGETLYLEKLSGLLGLSVDKTADPVVRDSVRIQFIVTRTGMLAELQMIDPPTSNGAGILQAIKRLSCVWSRGMFSGRPVLTQRKMTIMYSKDPNGNIVSLDDLEYRYDK
ncbi:hypothetical protein, partial [Parapedobacter sp. 10938]|uniref:hypothetical protein n=1 Tax=Parapedobacter flavus TaxID=3110225 RepID=UPI002DBF6186